MLYIYILIIVVAEIINIYLFYLFIYFIPECSALYLCAVPYTWVQCPIPECSARPECSALYGLYLSAVPYTWVQCPVCSRGQWSRPVWWLVSHSRGSPHPLARRYGCRRPRQAAERPRIATWSPCSPARNASSSLKTDHEPEKESGIKLTYIDIWYRYYKWVSSLENIFSSIHYSLSKTRRR